MSADWCADLGAGVTVSGTHMEEYGRQSLGERWCFSHRARHEFFRVCYRPVGHSYYGPGAEYRGPWDDCTDLFPGWTREPDGD